MSESTQFPYALLTQSTQLSSEWHCHQSTQRDIILSCASLNFFKANSSSRTFALTWSTLFESFISSSNSHCLLVTTPFALDLERCNRRILSCSTPLRSTVLFGCLDVRRSILLHKRRNNRRNPRRYPAKPNLSNAM